MQALFRVTINVCVPHSKQWPYGRLEMPKGKEDPLEIGKSKQNFLKVILEGSP